MNNHPQPTEKNQDYSDFAARLAKLLQQCDTARSHSPLAAPSVNLIAVSKNQPGEAVEAALNAGLREFGENRYQEGWERWAPHKARFCDLKLHFLGALQSNKAAEVVAFFDTIHSLDRPKLAAALARAMEKQQRRLPCYIQVNTGEEPQKAGVLPAEAPAFIKACREEYHLPVVGLMCIPPEGRNPAPHFAFLRQLAADHGLERLSMGMSSDFEAAIRLGATDIRLGTVLFGRRSQEDRRTGSQEQ
jgi:PLP dependent protein